MTRRKRRLDTDNTMADSYVVRIYRRTAPRDGGSGTLVDLVEDVHDGGVRHPFHSISELWDVLGAGERGSIRRPPRLALTQRS